MGRPLYISRTLSCGTSLDRGPTIGTVPPEQLRAAHPGPAGPTGVSSRDIQKRHTFMAMSNTPPEEFNLSAVLVAAEQMRLRHERYIQEHGRDPLDEQLAVDPALRGIAKARAVAAKAEALMRTQPPLPADLAEKKKQEMLGAIEFAASIEEIFKDPSE